MLVACHTCGVVNDVGPYRRACGSCNTPLPGGGGNVGFPERLTADPAGYDAARERELAGTAPASPAALNERAATQSTSAVDTAINMRNPADVPSLQDPAYGQWAVPNPVGDPIFGLPEQRVALRGLWNSPVFDMRPDLAGDTSQLTRGEVIYRGQNLGQGARLIVRLKIVSDGLLSAAFYNYQFVMRVGYIGSEVGPAGLEQIHAAQSITASVWNNKAVPFNADGTSTYTHLVFAPPANPVRFFQVGIVVDRMVREVEEAEGGVILPVIPPRTNTHFVTHWLG
jgi:hypothetical protein